MYIKKSLFVAFVTCLLIYWIMLLKALLFMVLLFKSKEELINIRTLNLKHEHF